MVPVVATCGLTRGSVIVAGRRSSYPLLLKKRSRPNQSRDPVISLTGRPLLRSRGFLKPLRFKKTWRPYQARVLSEFDAHVEDRRVHVVAAPGSGKTVLGIEIARVLGSPTLILAPTLAIRDQWIERLTSDFLLDGSAVPGWISTDIRRPEFVTVATYQLLHSVCTGDRSRREAEYADEDGDEAHEDDAAELEETGVQIDVAGLLNRHGFKTVILDECHHLRNEWWKSLTQTVTGISEVTIAALTATPPYDVSPWEWERYIHMCGPVDAEIAVPELVREGNLCCHQDYVYLSLPQEDEANRIGEFRRDVDAFVDDIRADTRFWAALLSHRWVQQPDDYAEQILADPEYLSAIAVYLNGTGMQVPKRLLHVMGVERKSCPDSMRSGSKFSLQDSCSMRSPHSRNTSPWRRR